MYRKVCEWRYRLFRIYVYFTVILPLPSFSQVLRLWSGLDLHRKNSTPQITGVGRLVIHHSVRWAKWWSINKMKVLGLEMWLVQEHHAIKFIFNIKAHNFVQVKNKRGKKNKEKIGGMGGGFAWDWFRRVNIKTC